MRIEPATSLVLRISHPVRDAIVRKKNEIFGQQMLAEFLPCLHSISTTFCPPKRTALDGDVRTVGVENMTT